MNVDPQDFSVQLYNIVLEYRPVRDHGGLLAEALKIMLCDNRQHAMQKAAAFIKRLATFSLCFESAESLAASSSEKCQVPQPFGKRFLGRFSVWLNCEILAICF